MKPKSGILAIVLLIVSCGLSGAQKPSRDNHLLSEGGQAAYEKLLGVERFSIGGVSFAGTPSSGQKWLELLVKEKDAVDACMKLLEKAKPAGQLYALYGLYVKDREAFLVESKRYMDSLPATATVETMAGCIGRTETVRSVVERIASGYYGDDFLRHPPQVVK